MRSPLLYRVAEQLTDRPASVQFLTIGVNLELKNLRSKRWSRVDLFGLAPLRLPATVHTETRPSGGCLRGRGLDEDCRKWWDR